MPPLRFSGSSSTGSPISATIEVVVDSTGVPIMSTFKVHGQTGNENHEAFYRYIQSSTFQPALRDGQPVEGVYRELLQFRLHR
jgi:hypothetical protein